MHGPSNGRHCIGAPQRPRRLPPLTPRLDPFAALLQGGRSLANPPPFSLQDLRDAIPKECFETHTLRSAGEHGALDARATVSGPNLKI